MQATTGFTSKISTALFTNDSRCTGVRMRFPDESSLDLPFFWSKPLRQPFPIFAGCQMAATTTRLRRIEPPFPAEECGLVCHSFPKLLLRLWGQVNSIDALGGDELAGIYKRQARCRGCVP